MGFGSWKENRGDGIMGVNEIWVLEGEWRCLYGVWVLEGE